MKRSFVVIGAGSWGTALAVLLARNGMNVQLTGHDENQLKIINTARINEKYLPGIQLPNSLDIVSDWKQACVSADDWILAIPSYAFREQLLALKPLYSQQKRIISVCKGLDPESNNFLHEVIWEILGETTEIAVLGGPSFAKEVANYLPTAVILASASANFLEYLVGCFRNQKFRVYTSDDIIGVEIGSVLKNIYAIATGISDGLKLGANARSALITRSLAEMLRFGKIFNARAETLIGLAGMGDLVLSCTDDLSRNRRLGLALGKGVPLEEALTQINQVVEGLKNIEQVHNLVQEHKIDMPIILEMYQVLKGAISINRAIENLLSREHVREQRAWT